MANYPLRDISREDLTAMLEKSFPQRSGRLNSPQIGRARHIRGVHRRYNSSHRLQGGTRWESEPGFSLELTRMIGEAEMCAGKLVNGSFGEWCPNTAGTIEDLWSKFASQDTSTSPSKRLVQNLRKKLHGCLGDYDNGLHSTLDSIKTGSSPSSKRRNISQKQDERCCM